MLKGTGFTDEDLAKPIIGVGTTWIETMPCNLNQRDLAVHVKRGVRDAGGTPMEFNTIAVSDGVSMGTSGMRASLVSREVIADSIELVARGHLFDGLVCLVACDKTNPGAAMAVGRLDIPSVVYYTGSIAPGLYRGREVSIADVYEGIGAHAAGKLSDADLHELESAACPGAGACGGQFTANTMSTILDFLGLSPIGANGIPAMHRDKEEAAYEIGKLAVQLVRDDVRPRSARDEGVVRERGRLRGRHGRLDERRAPPRRHRPGLRDRVHDRRLRADRRGDADRRRHEALGPLARQRHVPRRRGRARRARAEEGRPPARGGPLRRRAHARRGRGRGVETEGQEVVVPIETPLKPRGGVAVLYGNLAPDGCAVKLAGHDRTLHRGPARVFDSEEETFAAVKAGAIGEGDVVVIRYEGPHGGPGMREMLHVTAAIVGEGLSESVALDHRRALLGRDARVHGRPRLARGLEGRPARGAPRRRHRGRSTSTKGVVDVELSDEEIAARLAD